MKCNTCPTTTNIKKVTYLLGTRNEEDTLCPICMENLKKNGACIRTMKESTESTAGPY